jgi:formylglycine-generating enzyme required for sulfatase activity
MDDLSPIRDALLAPLANIFRDERRSDADRWLAAVVLADYARDDVAMLADLVQDATPRQFAAVFSSIAKHGPHAIEELDGRLKIQLSPAWPDEPLDADWSAPDPTIVARIAAGGGLVGDRFAFCQNMPMDEFASVAERLRANGYRPTRYRPFGDGTVPRAAAVWTRDGLDFRLASGATEAELLARDEQMRAEGFMPADVAEYVEVPTAHAAARFAALWLPCADEADDARMLLGQDYLSTTENMAVHEAGYVNTRVHHFVTSHGQTRYSYIRRKHASQTTAGYSQTPAAFVAQIAQGQLPIDVSLSFTQRTITDHERLTQILDQATQALTTNAKNQSALGARGYAHWALRQDREAIEDLTSFLAQHPHDPLAYRCRAIAYARLGNREAAAADVTKHSRLTDPDPSGAAYLDAVVAAWSGDVAGVERLRAALLGHEQEALWLYNSACAMAVAATAFGGTQPDLAANCADEAGDLLLRALAAGYTNFAAIQADLDLEAIRDTDAFRQVPTITQGQFELSLASLWETDATFESVPLVGLERAAHLDKCQGLAADGFRPVAISVAQSAIRGPESATVAASIWRRPVIADAEHDALAYKKANAAAALLKLRAGDRVWPLLKHSLDPRVRSFLIHAMGPLECDPEVLVDRLEHEADVSVRRALLLALGEFSEEQLPVAQRASLIELLLTMYQNDPDAGLHAASEWLLRQWGREKEVQRLLKELRMNEAQRQARKEAEPRQWYVNTQGQTFVVLEPGEFLMGSPISEVGHLSDEVQHSHRLMRRFAIAAHEATHGEYTAFLARHQQTESIDNQTYIKTEDSPQIGVAWYDAAWYCNWLSEQEGIPREQFCYEPNSDLQYSEGMKARSNAADLQGYRLPTEAEWEYACRAGAVTSRYYGSSESLLQRYAWCQQNSANRTWPVGILKPNDMGLFDMLGNSIEWCHDASGHYRTSAGGPIADTFDATPVSADSQRVMRGGAFVFGSEFARSGTRFRQFPAFNASGFRVARTIQ